MRKFIIVIGMFVFGALAPPFAAACSCMMPPPPLEALENADAVFTGQVTLTTRATSNGGIVARVRLLRSFKGTTQRTVTVQTASNSAACGFGFKKGEEYLIYAYQADGALHTNICTRTQPLASASEDLDALGDGTEIGRPRGGCGGLDLVGALQAVIFVLIALVLVRRP